MKKNRPSATDELRRRAEERIKKRKAESPPGLNADALRLLHELGVHQIELEIQNEELRSARHEVETALQRYTELFEFAPIGYFAIAGDEIISEANLAAARLLGLPRSKVIGRRFSAFLREEHRQTFREFLTRVLVEGASGEPSSKTCELGLGGEGTAQRELHLTAGAYQGPPATALVGVEDITRRVHAEAALRSEARNKDSFLAALSHELRNPLAPIRNSLFVLQRAQPGGPQAQSAYAVMNRQVGQLTRIVDDLLDVTRIASGKVRLQRERTNLCELARRTVDDHRASFEASGVRLSTALGSEPLFVHADPSRLVQVIGNLLGNAEKFTPRGGQVEVGLRRESLAAVISVRDNGVGIAPELRDRLFEPFSQGPNTVERSRGGLGLGLAMVRGLVELHEGRVSAISDGLGRGSEFTVRLPLEEAPAGAAPRPSLKPAPLYRVLVIEDREGEARSLAETLERDGHCVRLAQSGHTGLELAGHFRPQLVFCRLELPEMDGCRVARAFRSDQELKTAYLVAMGDLAPPQELQRAFEAGFDRHLPVPASPENLEQLLAESPSLESEQVPEAVL